MEVLKATLRTRIGKKIEQETENAHFHAFQPRDDKLLEGILIIGIPMRKN